MNADNRSQTSAAVDAVDEREALARLSRVHGPAELGDTILALISPKDSAASFIAWSRETAGSAEASLLRQEVMTLSDGARLPCLEALLARMRHTIREDRRDLLRATRRVMAAHSPLRPLDRLHWLMMRRRLGDTPPAVMPPRAGNQPGEMSQHVIGRIASVTAYLSRIVPGPDATAGPTWYASVMLQIDPKSDVPPYKIPDGDGLAHALDEVEALPWMLRPVLVRGWVEAALGTSGRVRLYPMAADALRLAAGLLDSPMPPELARHFIELDWGQGR